MKSLQLLVACVAIAFSTTALACDDEDDPAPDGASVVQAHLGAGARAAARPGKGQQHRVARTRVQARTGRPHAHRALAGRTQGAAPRA